MFPERDKFSSSHSIYTIPRSRRIHSSQMPIIEKNKSGKAIEETEQNFQLPNKLITHLFTK
jgi:hypothetical protein